MTARVASERVVATDDARNGYIEQVREELYKVARNLDAYIPTAWLLEGSRLSVEIDLGSPTVVHAELDFPA